MPVYLQATYSKKLGLPGYSSHQYSLTVRTRMSNSRGVRGKSHRLYALLQSCVDRELQNPGFLPQPGAFDPWQPASGPQNGTGARGDGWACSPKQKKLILKMVRENRMDQRRVKGLARVRFGRLIRELSRVEASALIHELKAQVGPEPGTHHPRDTHKARAHRPRRL